MDTRRFLLSVVPWEAGYIGIHWQRPDDRWPGRSVRSVDDALKIIADVSSPNLRNNVFFCLSAQKANSGKRLKVNATATKSLWADMDVDPDDPEKYPSVEHAIAALLHFCMLVNIPPPSIIVASGGGIHAYWLSKTTLPVEDWERFALAFKTACLNSSLKIDAVCTADVVRVLRVPGTLNFKYDPPRPVRILPKYTNWVEHNFEEIFAELLELAPAPRAVPRKPIKLADDFQDSPVRDLGKGIEITQAPPIPLKPVMDGCGWIKEAYDTGGEKFKQPLWNLTTLAATFMEDGHDLAHRFANKHPTYVYGKTEELWERKNRERRDNPNLGWPGCRAIQNAGSTHCRNCQHLDKEKSPLNIGLEFLATVGPRINQSEFDKELQELGGSRPPELRLPEGYEREEKKGVFGFAVDEKYRLCCFFPTVQIGKATVPGRLMNLLKTQIHSPIFQLRDGHYGVSFIATTDKGGSIDVFLTSSHCVKDKLNKYLLSRFVLPNSESEGLMVKFAISWLDKLREEGVAARDPGHMGWHYEGADLTGFAYGGILYDQSGEKLPLRMAGNDEFFSWYMPQGSREAWLAAANLLIERKRPELDILIAVAFAAPLATFAGTLYGAILILWGEPGTSKSTGQMVAAAVWGHPKQTRESLNSTPKSIQGRLGRTRNFPAYWDDVQDERHQDNLFQTMFVASEGAEGGRLNPDASYKQRLEWQTLMVACSNASFVEYLTKKQRSTTAGMRRVFEIEFNRNPDEPGMINPTDASQIFQQLERNYGVVGAEYAAILATEHPEIKAMVGDTIKQFTLKVGGTGDESYWWNSCGILLAGAKLAKRLGVNLDVEAMEEFLVKAFHRNRQIRKQEGTEGGSYAHTEQALTGFLNLYVGTGNVQYVEALWVNRHTLVHELRRPGLGKPIFFQIARDERKILISKKAFREYLDQQVISPRPVFNGLARYFRAKEHKMTLGAGTTYAQAQEICFEIPVPVGKYEALEELMRACGPPKEFFHGDK